MKRIYSFFLFVLTSVCLSAQVSLPDSIGNLKLGKSSKTDVLLNVSLAGGKVSDHTDDEFGFSSIFFEGSFEVEKITFSMLGADFCKDTLVAVYLIENKENVDFRKIQAMKSRYTTLRVPNNSCPYLENNMEELRRSAGVDSSKVWSRIDNVNGIGILEGDSSVMLLYVACEYIFDSAVRGLSKALEDLSSGLGPDYDMANAVKGVAGLSFGAAKSETRSKLVAKYGSPFRESSHEIEYSKISIGGQMYDFCTFYFTLNAATNRTEFTAAIFQKSYNSWQEEEALKVFEGITSQYARKYTNEVKRVDKHNDKVYLYGMVDRDKYYPISISLEKSVSKGGEMRLYVVVSYYQHKLATLYNDEI